MGEIRDRRGKRYAARLGKRWSPPPGEEGGAQSALQGNLVKVRDLAPRSQIYARMAAKDHTRRY